MTSALRRPLLSVARPSSRRNLYSKRAEFTSINARGSPTTEHVDVWLGDHHESYVLVPKHVGNALKAACAPHGSSFVADPDTYPLTFDHYARRFTCGLQPFPQLVIPQDLPAQSSARTSPATLFISPATDTIALDGTPDFEFAQQSGESFRRLRRSLDQLADR